MLCFPSGFLTEILYAIPTSSLLILFSLAHTKYYGQIIQFSLSSDPCLSRDQVSYPYINYLSDYTAKPTTTSP